MLLAANWERFFKALVETIFKLESVRLWVELRQRRLSKLSGAAGGFTCFNPKVTWSTDNCLRSIFLLSFAGLSFKSIDFCLRNIFFAPFGWIWICCRKVDIFLPSRAMTTNERKIYIYFIIFTSKWIVSWFLLQFDNILLMSSDFYIFMQIFVLQRFLSRIFFTHAQLTRAFTRLKEKCKIKSNILQGAYYFLSARLEQCPLTITMFSKWKNFYTTWFWLI